MLKQLLLLLPVVTLLPNLTHAQNIVVEPDPFGGADPFGGGEIILEGNRIILPNGIQVAEATKKKDDKKEEGVSRPIKAQVAAQIKKLAEAERTKRMDFMGVVIEDVTRLCELDDKQKDELNLAAQGATERSMKKWHEKAERYFTSRLNGADSDAAKEILGNIGTVNFGGREAEQESETQELWKDALTEVLSDEQVKKYEAVVEERRQERIQAFTNMSLSILDNHLRLTPEQHSNLEKIVHQSVSDYLDDVQRYWGDYFEKGMLMSLLNAAPEKDIKAILTEKQFNRHKSATVNFNHFWDQKRRIREEEEKKKKEEAKKSE